MVLSAVYIKGFKTFARPVRMPLEGGVTAIVGPNGSGKSNVTDAVLFALGEQSAGVLRAGSMNDLIFSGSDSLPAAAAAEVTLVFDNESGDISLPYEEVSVTRRISREGETEYRINGARSRLSDVRAVAGEAGLGRHSILRQGSVDAIVSGGAGACRLALEEAAGLGVYRRRRLSASRRLDKAETQLEQSRRLEAELEDQLRRVEREAVAAREYREIEGRYRTVSLACLYRTATKGLDERRARLREMESRIKGLSEREEALKREEANLEPRLREFDSQLAGLDRNREAMEDLAEDLRAESLRADRNAMRLESIGNARRDPLTAIRRLEGDIDRVKAALTELEDQWVHAEISCNEARQASETARGELSERRRDHAKAEEAQRSLSRNLEQLRDRLPRLQVDDNNYALDEHAFERIGDLGDSLSSVPHSTVADDANGLRARTRELADVGARVATGIQRRQGALEAAIGRVESRLRALDAREGTVAGTRLYEVLRPLEGYGEAVEAALGDLGAGLLATDLKEGIGWLQAGETDVIRLDTLEPGTTKTTNGKPLIDCVEILDDRYQEGIKNLLSDFHVTESPEEHAFENGQVAVTSDGLRVTRTTVSRRAISGEFAREAHHEKTRQLLHDLEEEPRFLLAGADQDISESTQDLAETEARISTAATIASRTARVHETLRRECERRLNVARGAQKRHHERLSELELVEAEISTSAAALAEAKDAQDTTRAALEESSQAAESVEEDLRERESVRARLRPALEAGRSRHARLTRELERLKQNYRPDHASPVLLTPRAVEVSSALALVLRERRSGLRRSREEVSEAQRGYAGRRSELSRNAVELAGEIATARAEHRRDTEDLERAERASEEAAAEIGAEWSADLRTAQKAADDNPTASEKERRSLARKLHAFGDVNLLSLSQESDLRDRFEFVSVQRADAEEAASEIGRIIQNVDREIETSFTQTFGRVREAFGSMVPKMLRGASGSLELSEDGVEIGLKLGRKGWRTLKVLSGGERALLALSFLFSIFLSQREASQGAFCVLDEAEAALDDLNLARFIDVVDSYRSSGQFLLVTHQKRTMAAADVLYGVTQDATGATVVVSKRTLKD